MAKTVEGTLKKLLAQNRNLNERVAKMEKALSRRKPPTADDDDNDDDNDDDDNDDDDGLF